MHVPADSLFPIPASPIVRVLRPFLAFAEHKAAGGIVLLLCTVIALVWANSPWADSYTALWHTNVSVSVAGRAISHDLHFWVNDLLMAVFFFVVGLEIKRELVVGELASVRQAALPILAALGGVVFPALCYAAFNAGGAGAVGWGIPMATDIAFALGVMALLGDRVPLGLKVFLTALAIVDDIAAVLVIATFYTAQIDWSALAGAALCLATLLLLGRMGTRQPLAYAAGGLVLWVLVLASGVHATVAGVALAFAIPSRTPLDFAHFLRRSRAVLDNAEQVAKARHVTDAEGNVMTNEDQQASVHALEEVCEKVQPPLHRMEYALHDWVSFFIMPVFALANAGVSLTGDLSAVFSEPVSLGIIVGLLFGKPLGITLASWLAVRSGVASLPAGVTWSHVHAAGWLGGIGFTMSLFVAALAFTDEAHLNLAKLGILIASMCAGAVGSVLLLRQRPAA